MKKIWDNIVIFFMRIDYKSLWESIKEVFFLTVFAFLPLLFAIILLTIKLGNFSDALNLKIIPGEMLSYCLSFLAPSMFLLIKLHKTDYKLPLVYGFAFLTFVLYVAAFGMYAIAKNSSDPQINMLKHEKDIYFMLAVSFCLASIILRVYSVYHTKMASSYSKVRDKQQQNFNETFRQSI